MWLIPRLPDFQRRHPGAQVHLYAAGGPVDFAAQGVDVALRRNDFEWDAALHAERVRRMTARRRPGLRARGVGRRGRG